MNLTPDSSYSIQIFKGENWELTFERSEGITVLYSHPSDPLVNQDRSLVDLRLGTGQFKEKPRYCIKLVMDGTVFNSKGFAEEVYEEMIEKFNSGKMSIDSVKLMLEKSIELSP